MVGEYIISPSLRGLIGLIFCILYLDSIAATGIILVFHLLISSRAINDILLSHNLLQKVTRSCQCGCENHIRQKKCIGCKKNLRASESRRYMASFDDNKRKGGRMDPSYIFNKLKNRVKFSPLSASFPSPNFLYFSPYES